MDLTNNSLREEIQELKALCDRLEKMDINESKFNPPATEEEITTWELNNGITIPESYKDWLRFSNGAELMGYTAKLLCVKNQVTKYELILNEMVIIGHLGGSGKILCFTKSTGRILSLFDGEQEEFDSFKDVILELIRKGKSILGEDGSSRDVTAKLMAMLEAQRNGGGN